MLFRSPTNQVGKYTKAVSISAVVNLVLNVPLIHLYGVEGATFATVVSELTATSLQVYFARKQLQISKLFEGVWKYVVSGLIMFIVVRYLNGALHMSIVTLAIQVICGALIYLAIVFVLRAPFITTMQVFIKSKNRKTD